MAHRRNRNRRSRESEHPLADCVLPQRIIESILSRLPVKSLVRFKRVCKPWYNLVSDPAFINLHLTRFAESPKTCRIKSQLINFRNVELHVTREFDPRKPETFFVASSGGLLCLARPMVTYRILLWNPATRLWKVLPHPIGDHARHAGIITLGFGCNEAGDDHKVVRIFCMKGKKMKTHVEVYSSKSDCWKSVKLGFNFRTPFLNHQAMVKGNPYWLVMSEDDNMVLVQFDSTNTSFKMLPFPPITTGAVSFMNWEGDLGGVYFLTDGGGWLEWIYIYVYDGEKWEVKETLRPEGARLQVEIFVDYKKGKLVGRCKNGALFEYEVKKGSVRVFGEERGKGGDYQVFGHDESLAYVKGMKQMPCTVEFADEKPIDCILDGFFTCFMPRPYGDLELFYKLAY